ncbi:MULTISPECIES: hypothetical protein [Psychrobacter]|uniref:hypothetical protein n=1 Tax=Psychrobacter TaxID=497 RepID=UPI003FD0B3B3
MTTTLRKTNAHKKARTLSSGFLELIKAFVPTPPQGLASEYISLVMDHKNNDSTTVLDITFAQAHKPMPVWFRGPEGFQIVRGTIPEVYSPLIDGGLKNERRQTEK